MALCQKVVLASPPSTCRSGLPGGVVFLPYFPLTRAGITYTYYILHSRWISVNTALAKIKTPHAR
jgi:hypothetical protein